MPPIPGPPFSALYGTAPQIAAAPAADAHSPRCWRRASRSAPYKPTNSIFIRHYEADLERIKKLIREKLDIPLPQVKIEARMEILDRDDLFAIGVQWGGGGVLQANSQLDPGRPRIHQLTRQLARGAGGSAHGRRVRAPERPLGQPLPGSAPDQWQTGLPLGGNLVNLPVICAALGGSPAVASGGAGGIAFGITGSRYNVNLALEALRLQSKTRTLARPEVVTVENGTASISLGEEIPYATVSAAGTQYPVQGSAAASSTCADRHREGDITKIKMKVIIENNSRSTERDPGHDRR